jgi:hypothetical protein
MKNKSLVLIIILVLTIFCQNAFSQETAIDITAEITKGTEIPGVYYVYSAAGADVKGLVEKLNAYTNTTLEVTKVDSARPVLSNGAEYFEMYSTLSGSFIWSKDVNEYVGQEDTENLPLKAVSADAALVHIKNLGLLPKNKGEMVLGHVGSSMLSFYNPETKDVEEYEILRNVTFTRKLKGIDVIGGMRIVVSMGTNGELVTLVNNWPELSTKKIAKATKGDTKASTMGYLKAHYKGSSVKSVKVTESKLVMYDDGNGVVEPALYLTGKARYSDGVIDSVDYIVPVLAAPKAKYEILSKDVAPIDARKAVDAVEDTAQDEEL